MPEQAFRSAISDQTFDQDRGSGLDRERARLSGWRITDQASPATGKKRGEHQGYGRHERHFSRSRPLPQGLAGQGRHSGRPMSDRAFDQDRGSGLDREWARLSGWRIADQASPATQTYQRENAASIRNTAGMSGPFRGQDRSHRAGHARASGLFRGQDRPDRVRHAGAGIQVVRDDSGAGSSVVSNRWPTGSARAGPARPGHRPGCR